MKKFFFIILLMIVLFSLLFINGCEKKCKSDSDCTFDNCCNPSACFLISEETPECGSILVCEEPVPAVSCKCIEGQCIMQG